MALQEALDRQPDAPTRPVALDRLQRIPGARGRKPAARGHDRGETDLVQTDDAFEYVLDNIHVTVCRAGGPGVGRRDPSTVGGRPGSDCVASQPPRRGRSAGWIRSPREIGSIRRRPAPPGGPGFAPPRAPLSGPVKQWRDAALRGCRQHTRSRAHDASACRTHVTLGPLPGLLGAPFHHTQTVSLRRPFARRLARTLRPSGVLMRFRNPWHPLRLLLFGWYVRFMCSHSTRRHTLPPRVWT